MGENSQIQFIYHRGSAVLPCRSPVRPRDSDNTASSIYELQQIVRLRTTKRSSAKLNYMVQCAKVCSIILFISRQQTNAFNEQKCVVCYSIDGAIIGPSCHGSVLGHPCLNLTHAHSLHGETMCCESYLIVSAKKHICILS
jgi:hypothetical protein